MKVWSLILGLGLAGLGSAVQLTSSQFDHAPESFIYFEDSAIVLYSSTQGDVLRSTNAGKDWKKLSFGSDAVRTLVEHPFDATRAYAFTSGSVHYYTTDRGNKWEKFEIPMQIHLEAPIEFHAQSPETVLIAGLKCDANSNSCSPTYYYSDTGLKSSRLLVEDTSACKFAQSSPEFLARGSDKTVVCIQGPGRRLIKSDSFFANNQIQEIVTDDGVAVDNAIGLAVASDFLVAGMKVSSGQVELVVSKDSVSWERARFADGDSLLYDEDSFTILESTRTSIHIDVLHDRRTGRGTFYTSNSEGTFFRASLASTNRNRNGFVDIEKVDRIDGVLLANTVESNGDVRSKVSYDDGRSWSFLGVAEGTCRGDETCGLNLHSVSDHRNVGRIFSSPAPGILAGVGNTGTRLDSYDKGDLYISTDSGNTWTMSRPGPHMYEFGDIGNIVVAVPDQGFTSVALYSTDRGKTWTEVDLKASIEPIYLLTTPDCTSLNFVLVGRTPDSKYSVISLGLDDLYSRKCTLKTDGSGDFEKWYARYDRDGAPACLMGHKQYFWRRKLDAKCVAADLFNEPLASEEQCVCAEQDFECDTNFVRSGGLQSGTCVPMKSFIEELEQTCQKGSTYEMSAGYRLVPGNTCKREGGADLEKTVEKVCGQSETAPSPGKSGDNEPGIHHTQNLFDGEIAEYVYLRVDMTSDTSPETMLLRDSQHQGFITFDQGGSWERVVPEEDIVALFVHPKIRNLVYLVTASDKIYRSTDAGRTFRPFKRPTRPPVKVAPLLVVHESDPDLLIFHGARDCDSPFSASCRTVAYYSTNGGEHWNELQDHVQHCRFVSGLEMQKTDETDLVFCSVFYGDVERKTKLISSTDYFRSGKQTETHFDDIWDYAQEDKYLVVATIAEDERGKALRAFVTVDGHTFSAADFPANFHVDHQQAYTVLSSKTDAVFLHVTVSSRPGAEFGTLLKSNSNGTEYVMSIEHVNRNAAGYVDFDKLQGLEGVALVNVVANPDQAVEGARKALRTMMTHSDGSSWAYLRPPAVDASGDARYCSGQSLDRCSLNLHGFTERADFRDSYSSESAVGMMMAVGNVGDSLKPYKEANTYLTTDGGLSWKEVQRGVYQWKYGDSGAILVLVRDLEPTNEILYSLDEGDTWSSYVFSDELVSIQDIGTVPSDTSRKFALFGAEPASKGGRAFVTQIDFSGLTDRKCVFGANDDHSDDDFDLWIPKHPGTDTNCLFGHESSYHRKKKSSNCFVGRDISRPHQVLSNCTCTRQDFECDFNYALANDGSCQLVPGYSPPDHKAVCQEMPNAFEYWEPTGYRRVPISTCEGGHEFDKVVSHPCPGKENEYADRHRGLSWFVLFLLVLLSVGMCVVIGYIVYDNYSKKYGQIRLGEEDYDDDKPLALRYAVMAVAAVVAVSAAMPSLVRSAYTHLTATVSRLRGRGGPELRFATRGSFARGSRYAPVDEDDSELLGSDDDLDLDIDAQISDEDM